MTRILAKIIRKIGKRGFWYTAKWSWYQACERYREWSLGIETASWDERNESSSDPDCHCYEPLYYTCIDDFLRPLEIQPNEDVFLDYGSGKGRVLVQAGMYRFRRIIGVEMLAELNGIANENIRRVKRKLKCKEITTVTANAAFYKVPTDVTVIFLFNSFIGDALSAVQAQIRDSLDESPRKLTLIYMNPRKDRDAFADCDWLVQKRELPTRLRDEMRLVVYESKLPTETAYTACSSSLSASP